MLRFRRPIQSLITSSRYFIFMSSYEHGSQGSCRQRCQDGNGICLCRKSTFTRAASSCCTDNSHGKATEDSQDYRSRERQVLQWDKLSEDEKNIYFAHKHACMVSLQMPPVRLWPGILKSLKALPYRLSFIYDESCWSLYCHTFYIKNSMKLGKRKNINWKWLSQVHVTSSYFGWCASKYFITNMVLVHRQSCIMLEHMQARSIYLVLVILHQLTIIVWAACWYVFAWC